MGTIERKTSRGTVSGTCDPKFSGVAEAFVENFDKRGEVGAGVSITLEGKTVVDLWGGQKTDGGPAWERDTVCVVCSPAPRARRRSAPTWPRIAACSISMPRSPNTGRNSRATARKTRWSR